MKLGDFLQKYTEENAVVDLVPGGANNVGALVLKIKFGKTQTSIAIPKGQFKALDQKGHDYKIKIDEAMVAKIQEAVNKEKNNDPQYEAFSTALTGFKGQIINVYMNKAEIYYNSDTGQIQFR